MFQSSSVVRLGKVAETPALSAF